MGIRERWRALWSRELTELEPARKLELKTGFNVRELGGYAVGAGETAYRRFLRSGGLDMLSAQDQQRLYNYGVRLVVDLRGDNELEMARDRLAEMRGVRFLHAPLYDFDLSDPLLDGDDGNSDRYSLGYLTMLANREIIRTVFAFFATAQEGECVLFHCAAGMDRTGVTAMLLLGLVGASKERIVADYCYSFGSEQEVDRCVFGGQEAKRLELKLRIEAMSYVIDRLLCAYGSYEDYLLSCKLEPDELSRVKARLLR
ncbi:MAG: tyrosine-protein phosphatase [Coriobacteriales bacterium]|nr:tyrosine-protein phosphatase [Coriobacteriales bacterium]